MAEYYSEQLRTIAKDLKGTKGDVVMTIYADILRGAADRIDELQKQLGERIEQVARLTDENQKLKNVQVNIEPIVY
jgi:hypothetical protein